MISSLRFLACTGFALLLCSLLPPTQVAAEEPASDWAGAVPPNIVLVYADDVDCEMVFGQFPQQETDSMPFKNLRALAREGVRFSNFHVTTPVCGPSRACLYTGRYAHHNGCRVNDPSSVRAQGFDGGFRTFDAQHELASWMKSAGYATAHVGKYLHSDFKPNRSKGLSWQDLVPPGWDHFRLALGGLYFDFPTYVKRTNTFENACGQEYRTDWDVRQLIDVLQLHVDSDKSQQPLFLCWAPIAAHIAPNRNPMAAARHRELFLDARIPEFHQRLQREVRGQIPELKALPIPPQFRQRELTDVYRDRLRAMQGIDEGVGAIRGALADLGMLDNTLFIFTSDHGFRFACHRHYGKRLPYDRITRVPFIAAGPNLPQNTLCDELLCNIDIAPTLVRVSGQQPPESCDGISFAELLLEPVRRVARDSIMIENWGEAVTSGNVVPATYSSLRSRDSVYTEWASGGREFFDLAADPEQLHNRVDELTEQQRNGLSQRLKAARKSNRAPIIAKIVCQQIEHFERVCASHLPLEFTGIVEADAGIKKVELEFRCVESGEYFSGQDWSEVRCGCAAELRQSEGLVSDWHYALDTSRLANDFADEADEATVRLMPRQLQLELVVTDLLGRQTRKSSFAFELSFLDPETTILPSVRLADGAQLQISGEAADLRQLKSVRVSLIDPATDRYWDGSDWQSEFCQLPAKLLKDGRNFRTRDRWLLEVAQPSSSELVLAARTFGVKGYDRSPAIKRIELRTQRKND